MRLVLVGPVYPFRGGIAHFTTVLYRELLRAGHEVLLISFQRQYPRWLFPGRSDRDPSAQAMAIAEARYLIDPFNPFSWLRTVREIRAYRPQGMALQWWLGFWAPVWLTLCTLVRLRRRTQVTIICHNVLPHEQRVWDRLIARSVLRLADQTVVQSTSEKDTLLALVPHSRVAVIPHPLYDMLAQDGVSRETARERLGIAADLAVLLFFGFVREYKGLSFLIDALPAVRKVFPDVRLFVVGEFWQDKRSYEKQIEALGLGDNIILVDRYVPNEEVPTYFRAADLVTLPYTAATQSGVLQLALGFGLPVVATRVGGLAEAVVEDEDVVLVEPANAAALSSAILAFLARPPSNDGVRVSRMNSEQRWRSLVGVLTCADS
jgi:glycosyltransferase involved in cell wall biosynthesis